MDGSRIRTMRQRRGWSQSRLARDVTRRLHDIGIATRTITGTDVSRWEWGRRDLSRSPHVVAVLEAIERSTI